MGLRILRNMPASKLSYSKIDGAFVLVANTATGNVVSSAENLGASYVAAKNFGKIDSESGNVELVSL